MEELQVLLDARGATPGELATAADTLLASVPGLEVVDADPAQLAELARRVGPRARTLVPDAADRAPRRDVPVLVAPGRAAYARGAVRRMLSELSVPGRCAVCVLVPGEDVDARVALWAPAFLGTFRGSLADLSSAGLAFDREYLPAGSPVARVWLRSDSVGIAPAADVGDGAARWALATGLRLDRDAAVASVRAPLGVARRRVARRRQRRAGSRGVRTD